MKKRDKKVGNIWKVIGFLNVLAVQVVLFSLIWQTSNTKKRLHGQMWKGVTVTYIAFNCFVNELGWFQFLQLNLTLMDWKHIIFSAWFSHLHRFSSWSFWRCARYCTVWPEVLLVLPPLASRTEKQSALLSQCPDTHTLQDNTQLQLLVKWNH